MSYKAPGSSTPFQEPTLCVVMRLVELTDILANMAGNSSVIRDKNGSDAADNGNANLTINSETVSDAQIGQFFAYVNAKNRAAFVAFYAPANAKNAAPNLCEDG
ncbi:hypothetical protein V502_01563 [Pseudogymnoascus sp. VKM F-4520 (FW-2644)]|nr:hypothetical protein V502_01563 [Pseudogymnoascus sp. VKM F-4520 (FW-2644)]